MKCNLLLLKYFVFLVIYLLTFYQKPILFLCLCTQTCLLISLRSSMINMDNCNISGRHTLNLEKMRTNEIQTMQIFCWYEIQANENLPPSSILLNNFI